MPIPIGGPLGIDPRVDIVFHAVFADPAHEAVRIDFLSAVFGLRLLEAQVVSPYSLRDFSEAKGMVVDVRARDDQGRLYLIEMQRRMMPDLPQRMLCGWAKTYAAQLERGDPYGKLRPVLSVWVCEADPFPDAEPAQLTFQVRDAAGRLLHPDLRIEVLQLRRWARHRDDLLRTPTGRWFWFFNEAARAEAIPDAVASPALEEAMDVLKTFHDNAELGALYRSRESYEHIEASWKHGIERAEARAAAAEAHAAAVEREKQAEKALAEAEKARADAAEREKQAEKANAEAEKARADAAEREKQAEKAHAEAEKARADAAERELEALRAALAAASARRG
jgi:predicted transposase/invertase (TIGR01784 family)